MSTYKVGRIYSLIMLVLVCAFLIQFPSTFFSIHVKIAKALLQRLIYTAIVIKSLIIDFYVCFPLLVSCQDRNKQHVPHGRTKYYKDPHSVDFVLIVRETKAMKRALKNLKELMQRADMYMRSSFINPR